MSLNIPRSDGTASKPYSQDASVIAHAAAPARGVRARSDDCDKSRSHGSQHATLSPHKISALLTCSGSTFFMVFNMNLIVK